MAIVPLNGIELNVQTEGSGELVLKMVTPPTERWPMRSY